MTLISPLRRLLVCLAPLPLLLGAAFFAPRQSSAQSAGGDENVHLHAVSATQASTKTGQETLLVSAVFSLLRADNTPVKLEGEARVTLKSADGENSTLIKPSGGASSIVLVADASAAMKDKPDEFARMREGLGQFVGNGQSGANVGVLIVGRGAPLNTLQQFSDAQKKLLLDLTPNDSQACVNATLGQAIELLKGAREPRAIFYVSTGPDQCNPNLTAGIAESARQNKIEIYAIGLQGTNAQAADLAGYAQPGGDGIGGVVAMVDNTNGGNLRDMLMNFMSIMASKVIASWDVYPKAAGPRAASFAVVIENRQIPGGSFTYIAPKRLSEPVKLAVTAVNSTASKVYIRLQLAGRELMQALRVTVTDLAGKERPGRPNTAVTDTVTIDTADLRPGDEYVIDVAALAGSGDVIAQAERTKFKFSPEQSSVQIRSFSLPDVLLDKLVITPTLSNAAGAQSWRIELVDANKRRFANWFRVVSADPVLQIDNPNLPDTTGAEVFLEIQALDSADNPIPGAVAISAEPVLYSQPGLMARASAWLRADPFRLIIVFVAIAALAVGIVAISRMLRRDAAVAPLIPIETLKKPYGSKSEAIDLKRTYGGGEGNSVPACSLALVAPAGSNVRFAVKRTPYTLGRSRQNDGVLPKEYADGVSSQHAILEYQNGRWQIRDAGSTYKTMVNSTAVSSMPYELSTGDEIGLGPRVRLRFRFDDGDSGPGGANTGADRRGRALATLTFVAGGAGDPIEILLPQTTIGRAANSGLQLPVGKDSGVSGQHALIKQVDGRWTIEDIGSSNGTFVDGQRLAPGRRASLKNGSVIGVGPGVKLEFRIAA